jgi:hypothetical protein
MAQPVLVTSRPVLGRRVERLWVGARGPCLARLSEELA